jgi:hypothetical protein
VRTNPRQFGAIRNEPGNLCLRETAWWAREDSNYVPITQSLSNRSPAGSKSASANCRRTREKGLAIGRERSVTIGNSGRLGRSEILPCRLDRRGGASVVRREAVINRTEDLDVKVCEEAVTRKICIVRAVC